MSQADIDVPDVGWDSDSVAQQIQEQSAKYGVDAELSGYAALTRPTKQDELEFGGIPKEWCRAKLGDIADQITKGTTPTTAGFQYLDSGVPFIKIENINQHGIDLNTLSQFISEEAHKALLRSQFQEGDILFSIAGTIGKTALVTQEHIPANTNQAVAIIRGTARFLDTKFLRQQLKQSAETIAKSNARGGAMNNISLGDLKEVDLSIPSFSEQQQIADQLDDLLAQVDTLKTRLDTIPKILKRFRQSVLVAAMNGRLTEEWRAEANITKCDIGSKLADERIRMWPGKRKYKSAISPDEIESNEFIDLPASWLRATLDQITWSVKDGPHFSPKYQDKGIPFISGGSIRPGKIDLSISKYISEELHQELSMRCKPEYHDILYTKGGTTGLATVNTLQIDFNVWVHVAVLKLVSDNLVNPFFVQHALNSQDGYNQSQKYTHGVGNQDLGLTRMIKIILPVPPIEEQTEIVRRVEQLFTYADQIEQRVKDAQARVNHLTQSILAKAFRGELTADWREQNPDLISGENSAEALLAKIKADRECATSKKARKTSSI
ncbi:MAG: restriction endonuclease subunit S [Methylobacter sp.]|nr:restriction endonuclease subunit S [Methylobacter sp.]